MGGHEASSTMTGTEFLYELSLSVGQSLDLTANCERFIDALAAASGSAYAAVWTRPEGVLDRPVAIANPTSDEEPLVLVCSHPAMGLRDRVLLADHPVRRALREHGSLSLTSSQAMARRFVPPRAGRGVLAWYALGDPGVLEVFWEGRERVLAESELGALRGVVAKLAESVNSCLVHRRLVSLVAGRSRLAAALEQLPESVLITDSDGYIQYVNPAFTSLLGFPPAEIVGRNPRVLKSGRHERDFYEELWSHIVRGKAWHGRLIDRRKTGALVTCGTTITPILDDDGRIVSYLGVQRDADREAKFEEQYLQTRKIECVSRLAGGIAHEFNEAMTAVTGYASLVLEQLGDPHPLRHAVEQIVRAGAHATILTRRLLAFSGRQTMDVQVVDVNAILTQLQPLFHQVLGADIELECAFMPDAGAVRADLNLLQQAVLNLVLNARQAIEGRGRVVVRTSKMTAADVPVVNGNGLLFEGDVVLLSVKDTGCGMTPEVLQHAFEPFFTTRPEGKATGLGLPAVYGIVRKSGGQIALESSPGAGTEAKIWLPRVEVPQEALSVEVEHRIPRGSETILVVEDSDMVRELTCQMLSSLGYNVLEATTGEEALGLIQGYTGVLDAVLVDVIMARMSGPEFVERVVKIIPGVKVVYMTGIADDFNMDRQILARSALLIPKPFTLDTLAEKIREVLRNNSPISDNPLP